MSKSITGFVAFISCALVGLCNYGLAQTLASAQEPPLWAQQAIWYQVFVERFNNGDKTNDPTPADIAIPPLGITAPAGWSITPWTLSWWEQESWAKVPGRSFSEMLQYRRYGGDLQGVIDKLNYLQSLGVTALYLNPVNDAPSLHKYDARYYHHVDVNFGPDPAGDNALIATENPNDPTTWRQTAADKLLLKLIKEVHKRNMKIILDFSWNHTGTTFWAWTDILQRQEKSAFKDWYAIKSFDNPATPENEFDYHGWLEIKSLPEIRKVEITTERRAGLPYEGNLPEGFKAHVLAVTKRWLAPDGVTADGVDGFRLDVADHIGLGFWREYRNFVKAVKPEAYLVGEIWWEQWPDKMMNPVPYTRGDVFDAIMFYQVYSPARYFFAKTDFEIDAQAFKDSLEFQWNRLARATRYGMMNVSSSHDTPRLLTDFFNPNKYKFNTYPENKAYKTNKPDAVTYQRLRLYLVHLFTTVGAPHIWNGEEMGMWGADDPHPRKPLLWPGLKFAPERRDNYRNELNAWDEVSFDTQHFSFYKKLIQIRKAHPELITGEIEFTKSTGKLLGYRRYLGNDEVLVLFNASTSDANFQLPVGKTYIYLLNGRGKARNSISVKALKAVILKLK
ncbi:MAG: glycoside hydrolase family 13 protein [Cyclobacteriaceae bacterium]|nr:glycoside hydrolase family 13 protein [Cyclobacteriaceae bacterium]